MGRSFARGLKGIFASILLFSSVSALAHGETGPKDLDTDSLTPEALDPILQSEGLVGWVHGAAHAQGLYVFTVRHPMSFFINAQFPMIAIPPIAEDFADLHRHDRVRIRGFFIQNEAPLGHILVTELEVLERWEGEQSQRQPYEYQTTIPDALHEQDRLLAVVHAVEANGRVLVIEYGDVILPVFVDRPEFTESLFRNDKIELIYDIAPRPTQPTHLSLAQDAIEPVRLLDAVVELHEQPISISGRLVMFEQSPQIIFNVFAVEDVDELGLARHFTLINFEDPQAFAAIRQKLQTAWDEETNEYVNGRNKLISNTIYITASGTGNVIAINQANPQILLDGPWNIEIHPEAN